MNDLADSGIVTQAKDIIKKSREEAHLKSFKISVKAEDLQKALNPAVWPMRVKVREFIYYARKGPRQDSGEHPGQGHQTAGGQGQARGGGGQHVPGLGGHQGGQQEQRGGAEQGSAGKEGQQEQRGGAGHGNEGQDGQHGAAEQWQGAPTSNMYDVLDAEPSAPDERDL